MKTVIVWLLYMHIGFAADEGGPMTVDNISSKEECLTMMKMIEEREKRFGDFAHGKCIQYRKVVG